jgi:hypothetical protein
MLQLSPRASAAAAAAFVATLVWRFLTFTGFTNDHYAHLALAQQWLLGERPVRDFTDPGWPLTYLLSAVAWRVAGDPMWVEWALVATALAIAAACTVIAAHRLSRSVAIAMLVTMLEIVIFPRSYSYPKIAAYAVAACAMIAVAARPSWPRILLTAGTIALAFLLRHDHGLYIGIASAVCVALARHREVTLAGSRTPSDLRETLTAAARPVAGLTAATAAFLLPWILFITLNGGLPAYFETALEFARGEANASNLRSWPGPTLVPGRPIVGLAPPDRPLAQVEWTPETNAALRRTLEARYGLEFVRQGDEASVYYVRDTSAGNLEALGDDPHVAGTTGLGRVNQPVWRRLLAVLSPLRVAPAFHSAANADAWLFWLFWSLPVIGSVALAIRAAPPTPRLRQGFAGLRRPGRGGERWPGEFAVVAALIAMSLFVNAGFLRDILRTRFSDAIVPPALLGAWLLGLCWVWRWDRRPWQRAMQAASVVVLIITVVAVTTIAETGERLALTGIDDGVQGLRSRAAAVSQLLAGPHRQALAPSSRRAEALMPFFAYLDRCTSPDDRLIVTGESPDVVVLSGRRFASDGAVFGAWYSSAIHQDRTLNRLKERPALVVLLMDAPAFRARFPPIDAYIRDAYETMAEVPVEGAETIPILVLRSRVAAGYDRETGWPCFVMPTSSSP